MTRPKLKYHYLINADAVAKGVGTLLCRCTKPSTGYPDGGQWAHKIDLPHVVCPFCDERIAIAGLVPHDPPEKADSQGNYASHRQEVLPPEKTSTRWFRSRSQPDAIVDESGDAVCLVQPGFSDVNLDHINLIVNAPRLRDALEAIVEIASQLNDADFIPSEVLGRLDVEQERADGLLQELSKK